MPALSLLVRGACGACARRQAFARDGVIVLRRAVASVPDAEWLLRGLPRACRHAAFNSGDKRRWQWDVATGGAMQPSHARTARLWTALDACVSNVVRSRLACTRDLANVEPLCFETQPQARRQQWHTDYRATPAWLELRRSSGTPAVAWMLGVQQVTRLHVIVGSHALVEADRDEGVPAHVCVQTLELRRGDVAVWAGTLVHAGAEAGATNVRMVGAMERSGCGMPEARSYVELLRKPLRQALGKAGVAV